VIFAWFSYNQNNKNGYKPDIVIYLQPTSPLRTVKHLEDAFNLFIEKKADGLISVFPMDNKILKTLIEKKDGYISSISDKNFSFANRQELPQVYMQNGAIYIMKVKDFLKNCNFLSEKTIPFVMSIDDSSDVDSLEDLKLIEKRFD